ncbi:MAG: hypothetical protein AAFP69_11115, partial [Planctomycetota bacterium]
MRDRPNDTSPNASEISETLRVILAPRHIQDPHTIAKLWSDYGRLIRVTMRDSPETFIVKWIAPPGGFPNAASREIATPTDVPSHPRGWNTGNSHQRKLQSYIVEQSWYQHYAQQTQRDEQLCCRVPMHIATRTNRQHIVLVMEDLDAAGFSRRPHHANNDQIKAMLHWLADFHALF